MTVSTPASESPEQAADSGLRGLFDAIVKDAKALDTELAYLLHCVETSEGGGVFVPIAWSAPNSNDAAIAELPYYLLASRIKRNQFITKVEPAEMAHWLSAARLEAFCFAEKDLPVNRTVYQLCPDVLLVRASTGILKDMDQFGAVAGRLVSRFTRSLMDYVTSGHLERLIQDGHQSTRNPKQLLATVASIISDMDRLPPYFPCVGYKLEASLDGQTLDSYPGQNPLALQRWAWQKLVHSKPWLSEMRDKLLAQEHRYVQHIPTDHDIGDLDSLGNQIATLLTDGVFTLWHSENEALVVRHNCHTAEEAKAMIASVSKIEAPSCVMAVKSLLQHAKETEPCLSTFWHYSNFSAGVPFHVGAKVSVGKFADLAIVAPKNAEVVVGEWSDAVGRKAQISLAFEHVTDDECLATSEGSVLKNILDLAARQLTLLSERNRFLHAWTKLISTAATGRWSDIFEGDVNLHKVDTHFACAINGKAASSCSDACRNAVTPALSEFARALELVLPNDSQPRLDYWILSIAKGFSKAGTDQGTELTPDFLEWLATGKIANPEMSDFAPLRGQFSDLAQMEIAFGFYKLGKKFRQMHADETWDVRFQRKVGNWKNAPRFRLSMTSSSKGFPEVFPLNCNTPKDWSDDLRVKETERDSEIGKWLSGAAFHHVGNSETGGQSKTGWQMLRRYADAFSGGLRNANGIFVPFVEIEFMLGEA